MAEGSETVIEGESESGPLRTDSTRPPAGDRRFQIGMAITSRPSSDEVLAEKMNAEHIGQVIRNDGENRRRAWIDGLVGRILSTLVILCVLVLIGLLCSWTIAKEQYEITKQIVIGFLAFAGGYGTRSAVEKDKKKDKED